MATYPPKYVIVFNGPPGSGKDFATTIAMAYIFNNVRGNKARHVKLAEPLKKATHALFSDFFTADHYEREELKDKPTNALLGSTPRKRYIEMSENMVKPMYGKDFFGLIAARSVMLDATHNTFVFSDCGFIDELRPIVEAVGAKNVVIVQLRAKRGSTELTFEGDSRDYIGDEAKQEYKGVQVIELLNTFDRELFTVMVQGVVNKLFKVGEDL